MTTASPGATAAPSGQRDAVRAVPRHGARRRVVLSLALLIAVVAAALAAVWSPTEAWAWTALALATALVAIPTAPVHRVALAQLRARRLGLDVLASLSVVVVYAWALGTTTTAPQTAWDVDSVAASASVGGWGAALVACALVCLVAVARTSAQHRTGTAGDDGPTPAWVAPAVLLVAAGALAAWAIAGEAASGVTAAIAVLALACPGILGLAWPVAIGRANRRGRVAGVGPLSREAVAAGAAVGSVVLDGTATVTDGKRVASVDPLRPEDDRNLKWFAGALEHASDHPIGRAIARLSPRGRLAGVRQHPGTGISGSVDRHPVRVGRPDWIGIDPPDRIGTTVAIDVDGRPLGTITVVDKIRREAPSAVASLRRAGLDVVLVTDRPEPLARAIADQADVRHVVPEARTADETVGELVADGRVVARVRAVDPDGGLVEVVQPEDDGHAMPTIPLVRADVVHAATALALARGASKTARRWLVWGLGLVGLGAVAAATLAVAPLVTAAAAVLVTGVLAVVARG